MNRSPIHPGEILAEELEAIEVSPTGLARLLDVPANRISQIIQGKRSISADTALRLGQYFGNSPEFWINLQTMYDLDLARGDVGDQISNLPQRSSSGSSVSL